MNGMVSGDIGNYARKHTGTALSDATQTIQYQISKAKEHYDNLVADKETFKQIILTKKDTSIYYWSAICRSRNTYLVTSWYS